MKSIYRGLFAGLLASALILLLVVTAFAATLLPNGKQQFIDANGIPLAGGKVYFYVPNTTTPKNTWRDAGQTTLNANPVVLDAAGEAVIYGSGAYRQIVVDGLNNQIWDQPTADTASAGITWGGTSTGSANAQAVSALSFTQANGAVLYFRAAFTNTSATTLNVNGSGGVAIYYDSTGGPRLLTGGEIVASNVVGVTYDSSLGAYHLLNISAQRPFNLAGALILPEIATPSPPAAGNLALYGKSSDVLAFRAPGGAETTLSPGSSGLAAAVASSTITFKSGGVNLIVGGSPTVQSFVTGSGTYTPTAGTVKIRVRMCGGGGGGGAAGTATPVNGGTGGTTTFGSWTAIGGGGGATQNSSGGTAGAGGTGGATGTGVLVRRSSGQRGTTGPASAFSGPGGNSEFGAGGGPVFESSTVGRAGTGNGGGGGGAAGATFGAAGGGGAESVEFWVISPTATSYAVGAAGTAGTANVNGAAGTVGAIWIEEFYN